MNSNVRNSTGDEVLVHSVNNTLGNDTYSELLNLVRKMSDNQQAKNKEFESCIVNLID